MKKLSLFLAISLFALLLQGQNAIFEEFPPMPAVVSQDEIQSFIDKLVVLKDDFRSRISLMEKENEAAAQQIDPAKIAARYSGQMGVAEIQEMQKANEDMMNNQQLYTQTLSDLSSEKDSLSELLNKDSEKHQVLRTEYLNKCTGESSGNGATCDGLLKKVNESSQIVLKKFYFGKESLFTGYIIDFRSRIGDIHQMNTTGALELNEWNMGIAFPHKEDLAVLKMAVDVISEIISTYSIEGYLWPL
jgi:hypothetical protein